MENSKVMSCPLCYKEVYSEYGKSCRMCGMKLEDEAKEFCSKRCRNLYLNVHKQE